jgi:AcrR family transcriptional regulator
MATDGERREEILETAASLFASSGIRTSLKDIGDACGILPGSLYHHFDSKDAIVVELVQRYRDELDQVAKEALDSLHEPGSTAVEERVTQLGEAIATCAVRNRAALLLTLYEPPTTASDVLVELARQTPTAITAAMTDVLEAGRTTGEVRDGIDLPILSERICQSMLHVGVGVFHRRQASHQLPTMKCQVFLHGIAKRTPVDTTLDRSPAMRVAQQVIADWSTADHDDRTAHLRAIGRAEFARRGYEATTMRDVAKAAGLSTGTVYRTFPSKDELLLSIMQTFSDTFSASWDAVLATASTPIEKIDALLWVNINLLDRFSEEFKIQLAWLRQSPPDSVQLGFSFEKQLKHLQAVLVEGQRGGKLRPTDGSALNQARSMYEVILTPENVIRHAGLRGSLDLARETVLRGALARR